MSVTVPVVYRTGRTVGAGACVQTSREANVERHQLLTTVGGKLSTTNVVGFHRKLPTAQAGGLPPWTPDRPIDGAGTNPLSVIAPAFIRTPTGASPSEGLCDERRSGKPAFRAAPRNRSTVPCRRAALLVVTPCVTGTVHRASIRSLAPVCLLKLHYVRGVSPAKDGGCTGTQTRFLPPLTRWVSALVSYEECSATRPSLTDPDIVFVLRIYTLTV